MIYKKNFELNAVEDIKTFVGEVLKELPNIKMFCLYGDLGAGKTTICKEFIKRLTGIETVTSPTFNIVQNYTGNGNIVFHYDLYRIKNKIELYEIGLLENNNSSFVFIEWPEIAENLIYNSKRADIIITLSEEVRNIIVQTNLVYS